jgi:hypothetical protein
MAKGHRRDLIELAQPYRLGAETAYNPSAGLNVPCLTQNGKGASSVQSRGFPECFEPSSIFRAIPEAISHQEPGA